jgi:membrane fusion protein (multidrug efflux system)
MSQENAAGQDAETRVEDGGEVAAPSPLKNPRVRLFLVVVVLAALIGGGIWFYRNQTFGKYQQSTNDAFVQADAVVVASKLGGYVEEVFVTDNQQVKKGDPLIRIDPREYNAQVREAEAQIGVADAGAQGVRAQIREQQATIAQSAAQLAAARSRLAFARGEVARFAPLAATGAESGERLSQLRDQVSQAASQVELMQAQQTGAQRRIATLQAQIGEAGARRRAAEAQLSSASVNLGSTIIRASADGRIGNKTVQTGQFVQPGIRLMSVVPVQRIYVTANFKETQLALMRVNQPVTVHVDALEDVDVHGRVESFSPGTGAQFSLLPPQNATGNFTKIVQRVPVHIAIDAGPRTRALLLPGLSVEVSVDTRSANGEREAIEREQNQRQGR